MVSGCQMLASGSVTLNSAVPIQTLNLYNLVLGKSNSWESDWELLVLVARVRISMLEVSRPYLSGTTNHSAAEKGCQMLQHIRIFVFAASMLFTKPRVSFSPYWLPDFWHCTPGKLFDQRAWSGSSGQAGRPWSRAPSWPPERSAAPRCVMRPRRWPSLLSLKNKDYVSNKEETNCIS